MFRADTNQTIKISILSAKVNEHSINANAINMTSVNYIQLIFTFFAFFIVAVGALINCFERYLPVFISDAFRYGKFAYKGESASIKPIKVPKSWFRHIYVFATLLAYPTLFVVVRAYLFGVNPPLWVRYTLDLVCGEIRAANCKLVLIV